MKKLAVVTVVGMLALAACTAKTPAQQNVIDAGDNAGAMLDNSADNLDAMADNATNATTANMLENAADNAHAAADSVRDVAKNSAKDVKAQ